MDAAAKGLAFLSHCWTLPVQGRIPAACQILRWLCLLLLAGRCSAAHRKLQEEEVPEFDFDVAPTDRFRTGVWEIVTGYFYIRGGFLLNNVGDIAFAAKEMLAGVCDTNLPTNVVARQDILTLNQPQVGLNMTFQILAPDGWAKYCVATLRFVGYGPSEGPFEQYEPPPIRPLVQAALAQYTTLDLEQVDYWAIEVGNVACREALVSYGSDDAPPYLLERSTMPDRWRGRDEPSPCGEALQVKWTPSSAVKYPWEEKPCLAAPTPCICASIRTCRYLPHASGGKRCVQGWETENDFTRVDCEDCPYQADCPPTCKDAYTPCMCVWWNCTWDVARSACEPPAAGAAPLSCLLCARQPHCMGLAVEAVSPPSWSLLGDDDIGWFINVTFNRPITFGPLMQTTEQAIHMSCQSEAEAGMVPPVFVRFDLQVDDLAIVQETLHVDARKVPNPLRMRFCELKILEGAVVDGYWIPMEASWVSPVFLLSDTVAPTLQSWMPGNSARNIPLDVEVEIRFSEEVVLGLFNQSVSVRTMGSYGEGGPADKLVASFPAGSPRLRFQDTSLRLNLAGLLNHDVLYSVGLDPDLVRDNAGNSFVGLPVGIYAFRTVPEPYGVAQLWDSAPVAGTVTAISIAVLFVLGAAVAFVAWWKARGFPAGANKVAPGVEPEDQEELPEWSQEEEPPDAPMYNGTNSFGEIMEDLRSVHASTREKATQEDVQAVTFQPQLDDSYYATFHNDELGGDSTVLEPDLTIVHKARPLSASSQRPGPEEELNSPPSPLEVYEYYAFPPPWSVDDLACPASRPVAPSAEPQLLELPGPEEMSPKEAQVPAICNDPDSLRMDSKRSCARNAAVAPHRPKSSRKSPASAHQTSKDVIKSLHDSLRASRPPARTRRPQSAPSQRVQERLMQSGAIVFRESDKRLPSYSTGFLEAEQRRSRPASAAQSRPQSAAQSRLAIGDAPVGPQLLRAQSHGGQSSGPRIAIRPKSATPMARSGTELGLLAETDEAPGIPEMVLETAPDGEGRLRLLGQDEELPALRIIRDHSPSLQSPVSATARSWGESPASERDDRLPPNTDLEKAVAETMEPQEEEQPASPSGGAEAARSESSDGSESASSSELKRGIGMPWSWQDGAFLKHQEQLFKDPNTERIFQTPKSRAAAEGECSPLARRHKALGIRSRSSVGAES